MEQVHRQGWRPQHALGGLVLFHLGASRKYQSPDAHAKQTFMCHILDAFKIRAHHIHLVAHNPCLLTAKGGQKSLCGTFGESTNPTQETPSLINLNHTPKSPPLIISQHGVISVHCILEAQKYFSIICMKESHSL